MPGKVFTDEDLKRVSDNIPRIIYQQLSENDILLAGGYIRDTLLGLTPSDLDIFVKTNELAKELAEYRNGGLGVMKTDCAYTTIVDNIKIQYVYCRPFTDAPSLLNEFDFTCCQAAFSIQNNKENFCMMESFEQDSKDRRLVFTQADYNKGNLGALSRAFRFVAKGWTISQFEMAKIVHHYVAYSSEVLKEVKASIAFEAPLRTTIPMDIDVGPTWDEENQGLNVLLERDSGWPGTTPPDVPPVLVRPTVRLSSVQSSVNPRYNPRNRRRS